MVKDIVSMEFKMLLYVIVSKIMIGIACVYFLSNANNGLTLTELMGLKSMLNFQKYKDVRLTS